MSTEKDKVIAVMLKEVLSWDIRDLRVQTDKLSKVPHYFTNVEHYVEIFEPLIFEETRAQIVRSLTDSDSEDPCAPGLARVRYLGDVGDFCVAGLSLSDETILSAFRDNDLFVLSVAHPDAMFSDKELEDLKEEVGEADNKPKAEDPETAEQYLHLVGIIENIEPGGVRARFYLKKKGDQRAKTMAQLLSYDREWWIMKLTTLSTLQREFLALHQCHKFPLIEALLTGECEQKDKSFVMEIPAPLKARFENMYNGSQMQALQAALSGDKITLIQGPPGTGKTHVISGVLSVLLHSKEVPIVERPPAKKFKPFSISEDEKQESWKKASPWLSGSLSVIDDFSEIDPEYENTMARKRRAAKLRPNEPEPFFKEQKTHKRILLCAPSNGAVDELVQRIMKEGLLNAEGQHYTPALVRVGPGAHRDVEHVTLEAQAKARIVAAGGAAAPSATGIHMSMKKSMPLDPKTIRSVILGNASIIATTLSFSGSNLLEKIPYFDYVIIDEAAQAVETSTLVALKHQAKSLVIVGDPRQLPATIISKASLQYGYDQSLFQRLMLTNAKLSLLRTQYRMHPRIRQFPSDHFYESQLEDAPTVAVERVRPYHNTPCFGPFVFYDVRHSVEAVSPGASYYNDEEAKVVLAMYRLLVQSHPDITDMATRVGVISPYKHQVTLLRTMFKEFPGVNVDTVDGYQGREREIIFFSCVRAPKKGQKAKIGFLSDVRRMNVALTRPRSSLIVVGNTRALKSNEDWRALVNHAVETRCYVRVQKKLDEFVAQLTNAEAWEGHLVRSLEETQQSAIKRKNALEKKAKKTKKVAEGGIEDDNSNNETTTSGDSNNSTPTSTSEDGNNSNVDSKPEAAPSKKGRRIKKNTTNNSNTNNTNATKNNTNTNNNNTVNESNSDKNVNSLENDVNR